MVRMYIGLAFLAGQIVINIYTHFVESRYFAWAPYDEISLYDVEVTIRGKKLTTAEALARYRISGRENRSIRHVKDIIRQYEETYGRDENVQVRLHYQTNGREFREWHWPLR